MLTLEKLSTMVEEEFENNQTALDLWARMKLDMKPHYETVFGPWHTDEYGNEVPSYEEKWVQGCASTYEDEMAYFCWKCGCGLWVTRDWIDGSETYYVMLPQTEEEYQKNLAEAEAWWKEVYEEE